MVAHPVRKLAYMAAAVVAVLFIVGLPTLGQSVTEPSGEITRAECYGHHKEAGFRSMDLFPKVVEEAPANAPFTFEMTIRNPWLNELQNVYGYVNISGAPGLSFPGEKAPFEPAPETGTFEASPTQHATQVFTIPVEVNATELTVALTGDPGGVTIPTLGGLKNDFDLTITSPDGTTIVIASPAEPDPNDVRQFPTTSDSFLINYDNLTRGGTGDWKAIVQYKGAEAADFTLTRAVYYNLSKSTEFRVFGAAKLMPGETVVIPFTINAKDPAQLQMLRYGGLAHAYHDHSDRNTEDDGDYDKWNTFSMAVGTTLRYQTGDVEITASSIDTLSPIFRRFAQVLGIAGSALVIPSLVFGGTFGKGSVTLLNRAFGAPRRRVLFHNSLSFWLLGTSLLHMFFLFYETQWGWSRGLVWGGLALACMIGLGLTGATQRSFVAKWGFTRWRFVHFAMGILVAVFVLVHMVADGTHLAPIREMFG